jgi:hypothetical protein
LPIRTRCFCVVSVMVKSLCMGKTTVKFYKNQDIGKLSGLPDQEEHIQSDPLELQKIRQPNKSYPLIFYQKVGNISKH